jgi:hypothetical protein
MTAFSEAWIARMIRCAATYPFDLDNTLIDLEEAFGHLVAAFVAIHALGHGKASGATRPTW